MLFIDSIGWYCIVGLATMVAVSAWDFVSPSNRRSTTAIYAKVDFASLRSLALPWPGGAQ